jgi:beta-galactosidase
MSPALGVCYYPEHWPQERWSIDAQMMAKAGIRHVRIGEFAWSRMEPEPGHYDFDWLDQAVDTLAAHGLQIVMGTPTATPPKWLVDQMPEMIAVDRNGHPRKFGSRRHYCFSHQGYQAECDRIVSVLAKRYGSHPAVTAWQTDNEYGCHDTVLSYSSAALSGFRDWLAQKYQSPQALNRGWGNVFWSMELRSFAEVELPNLTVTEANPSHWLDFRRYSSDQVVAFNRRQTKIIRAHAPDATLLHNYMGGFVEFDHFDVSQDLDAASWDSYPIGFLDRDDTDAERRQRYMRVGDPDSQAFHHDLYRACGRGRWWVMEQQPGPVNWAPYNPVPMPGAVRLWTWEAFAHGAEVVSYFRWRQAPFAQEQMHEALLLPDGTANEAYGVASAVSREMQDIDLPDPEGAPADVALVFDYKSAWAWMIQPQGASFVYLHLVLDIYRALRAHGLSVDVVPPDGSGLEGRKLVVAPGLFSIGDDLAKGLARSGAQVLLGPRSGAKTPDFQIPATLPPGEALQSLLPIRVRRVESLPPGSIVPMENIDRHFRNWREYVDAGDGVEVTMHTADGEAALLRSAGGKLHYLAGWPDPLLAREIIAELCERAGLPRLDLHRDIRVRDRGDLRFVFNHGPEHVDISGLIVGATLVSGEAVLAPCGVAILRQG